MNTFGREGGGGGAISMYFMISFSNSVGRCVIPCAFLVIVSNIHFLVEKYILIKKRAVYNFLSF